MQTLSHPPTTRPVPSAPATPGRSLLFHIGFYSLLLLVFVTFSRLAETLSALAGMSLRVVMVLQLMAAGAAFLVGSFLPRLRNSMGLLLILLTGWFILCIPTSVHKGGSVNHLTSYWFSTLLMSLCAMAYAEDAKTIRRMLYALVAGTLLVASVRGSQGSVFSIGALGNPNLYGQHILYAVPFVLLPVARHGFLSLRGVLAAVCACLLVAKVMFTGSRASLLAVLVLGLILFFTLPLMKKLALVVLAVPVCVILFLSIPETARLRYSTMFADDTPGRMVTGEELSAMESARARGHHFDQSVNLTLQNPLFGVGPGMFAVAAADESKDRGEKAFWKETHNSYSQISSETGFPGLFLYLAMIVLTGISLWRTGRRGHAARPGTESRELGLVANAMFYSLISMTITATFSSSAYLPYFPLLACLAFGAARLSAAEAAPTQRYPAAVPASPRSTPAGPIPQRPFRPAIRA